MELLGTDTGRFKNIDKSGLLTEHSVKCLHCDLWGWEPPESGYEQLGFDGPACVRVQLDVVEEFLRQHAIDKQFAGKGDFHHRLREMFDLPCDSLCRRPLPMANNKSKIIQQIKTALRVEEIAERLTSLHGNGTLLSGKCPLHGETRGESFKVWLESERWACFGRCNTSGDVLDLIEAAEEAGLTWTKNS